MADRTNEEAALNSRIKNMFPQGLPDMQRGQADRQRCAYDSIPEEDKGKPMWLYCGCPRCSPKC